MKTIIALCIFSLTCFPASAQTKVVYTCEMHPEVIRDKPGTCPKCGMTLVKKTFKPTQKKTPKKEKAVPRKKPIQQNAGDTATMMHMHHGKDSATMRNMEESPRRVDSANQIPSTLNMDQGSTVRYDLYVTDTMVNFTGKNKRAIAINGSIPAPDLVFTEGDTAEIFLHNRLKSEETSLHWHGVILPNRFDGVPYLTTARIGPGETHLYKFKVVQNGTYWYHSHTSLQEQIGMYGALIFKKRGEDENKSSLFNETQTLVLSEWSDEDAAQIQRRLRTGNDWYAIKKGSTQSYTEAIKQGHFKTKLINEWKRMEAMDVSDVYYNRFLSNGRPQDSILRYRAGDKVRLQVVNAGASSYFWLGYGGGKITVVANDGNDVEPVEVDRLIIGPAETYDVVVEIPANMSYEFRATPEDRSGKTSLWLGSGMKMPAPDLLPLLYFEGMKMMNNMMTMDGNMKNMDMKMSLQKMDMNSVMYPEAKAHMHEMDNEGTQRDHTQHQDQESSKKDSTSEMEHDMDMNKGMDMGESGIMTLNYDMLRSLVKTTHPSAGTKTLHFTLTGNMNRYLWTMDNKTVNESDKIMIRKGENLRIIMTNNSMMRHPMHLHGHDFRVVNSHGDYSPLKNVIDIMPMETDTIEFAANQDGNWFFHCHILYHMMAGMGRVFRYENSAVNPELPDMEKAYQRFKKENRMMHLMVEAGIESNGTEGEAMLSSNRYAAIGEWHIGYHPEHSTEVELMAGRYLGKMQWLFPYAGFDYHYEKQDEDSKTEASDYKNMFGQVSNKNDRKTFVVGLRYTAPWLLMLDARVDGDGKFRFQLSREDIPLSSRLRLNFMGNTDKEYTAGLRYIIRKWFALSTHYDSDMGLGAGITLIY